MTDLELDNLIVKKDQSEEFQLFIEKFKSWVKSDYSKRLNEHQEKGDFQKSDYFSLGQSGVFGTSFLNTHFIYDEFSGLKGKLGTNDFGFIWEEIEKVDSGLRSCVSVQSALGMFAIATFGTEFQKEKYLNDLMWGKKIISFGLTERNAGSDPGSMNCKAIKSAKGYILNGEKFWCTNSPYADLFIIWAKNEEGIVQGFILEREGNEKNITTNFIKGKWSLRTSPTGNILMQNCLVPQENVLEVKGLKGPLSCLSEARFGIAYGMLGLAKDCFKIAKKYSLERQVFGRPIAQKQLIQNKLADMASQIVLAAHTTYAYGKLKDNNGLKPIHISLVKRNNVRMAKQVVSQAREILGAIGITDNFPLMRHMMNLESVYTYEGTDDVHTLVLGHGLTGERAF